MKHLLAALGLVLALASPVQAQTYADAWINVYDPALEPAAPHVISRHYLLWDGRPNCAPGETARLVVAFHGLLGSAQGMADNLTPQGCYVAAYPSGSNKLLGQIRVSGNNLTWNTSDAQAVGWAGKNGVNDDGFINALVADLKTDFSVGAEFAVGFSQGGMLAFHLACDTALFSAFATVATLNNDVSCVPAWHAPNLHLHARGDDRVGWLVAIPPWPVAAKPTIDAWHISGPPHETVIVSGGAHAWDLGVGYDTTGTVWSYFDSR